MRASTAVARNKIVLGVLVGAVGMAGVAVGQDGSGSSTYVDGVAAADDGGITDTGWMSSNVGWLNVVELVLNSIIVFIGAVAMLWHFATFNDWIDSTLVYAEGAAAAGLGMAAGGLSGTIQTAKGGVTTLTDTAASGVTLMGDTLSRTGSSLTGSDGGSPRSGRRSPASELRDPTADGDDDDDVVDMSGSFAASPRRHASPRYVKAAVRSGGRRAANTAAQGVNDANHLATNTVTTGIKVPALCKICPPNP